MQQKKKWSLTILLFVFVIVCFAIAAIPALRNDSRPSPDGNLQLLPGVHKSDGFYMSLLRKEEKHE